MTAKNGPRAGHGCSPDTEENREFIPICPIASLLPVGQFVPALLLLGHLLVELRFPSSMCPSRDINIVYCVRKDKLGSVPVPFLIKLQTTTLGLNCKQRCDDKDYTKSLDSGRQATVIWPSFVKIVRSGQGDSKASKSALNSTSSCCCLVKSKFLFCGDLKGKVSEE